jgi:hypothetical protein
LSPICRSQELIYVVSKAKKAGIYQRLKKNAAGHQWFAPIVLATQEAEIRRIEVRSQPGQIVHETLFRKKPFPQKRAGGVIKV